LKSKKVLEGITALQHNKAKNKIIGTALKTAETQEEGQLKKILGTSLKEVGGEAAHNSLAQNAVKSQSSYQVQTGAMSMPTNQVTMNSTSNDVAMVVSSSEVDRTTWPSLCSIVTTVCKKLIGKLADKALSYGVCVASDAEIAGLCEIAGWGPEDPLADACAVALDAGWTKICTQAVKSGIPLTTATCLKMAHCSHDPNSSRRRRFWSATRSGAGSE